MSTEANKGLYSRWFEEVVNQGNMALADELLAPDYVLHFPGMPGPVDREAHKQLLMAFRTGFPDWHESVDEVIAEGDKVVIRVTGTGTHQQGFKAFPQPTAACGRRGWVSAGSRTGASPSPGPSMMLWG